MVFRSNKNGFMLVTVLMVLLMLAVISVGILYLSATGIQRTSAFQDSSTAYINALSGANMVSAFFLTIQRTPAWPIGEEFENLPTDLQSPYPVTITDNGGSEVTIGEFEVLSIERLEGSLGPNVIPQDFEVLIAGRSPGQSGDMANEVLLRMRVRIQAGAFTRWVYFLNTHPDDIWWIGVNDIAGRGTRLHGPVHFNERTNLYNTRGWYFDAEDPIFVSWDYGRTPNLNVVGRGSMNSSFRWGSSAPPAWDFDPLFRSFLWGSSGNPNEDWFGIAGWINESLRVTFGGWPQIDTDATYVDFPTRNETEATRGMIWNGDPESKPDPLNGGFQPAPNHNPEAVRIPDNSRPDGGIFIYGDVSIDFEAINNGLVDPKDNNVYNNRLIIDQPPWQTTAQYSHLLFRWIIDIERDEFGNIERMTRTFWKLPHDSDNNIIEAEIEQLPVFRNSGQMEEVFEGPFNAEGLGIYVDGNIGWVDHDWNDKRWLRNAEGNAGQGLTLHNYGEAENWLTNRSIKGLGGETYGRITIYSEQDIAITNDFIYTEYQVPMSPDFTKADYARTNYVNGIVARNVAIVPFFFDPSNPNNKIRNFDTPFWVDAGIICTGLRQAGQAGSRTHGSMGNLLYFTRFGTSSNNLPEGITGPNRIDGDNQKGRFILRGSYAANTRTAFGSMGPDFLRYMTHSWYYDLRFRIMTPAFFPQAGLRPFIFELSKVN